MWILKLNGRRIARFNDKQLMLRFIEEQHQAIRPCLTYEEKRGVETAVPAYPRGPND